MMCCICSDFLGFLGLALMLPLVCVINMRDTATLNDWGKDGRSDTVISGNDVITNSHVIHHQSMAFQKHVLFLAI